MVVVKPGPVWSKSQCTTAVVVRYSC